ncbi:polysaccharide biosynthesis protein [Sellimonas caecigallum]|uniref:Polysaccharide biosynthesis protein n=1 Tax=Sellimonas caecigallum TaxID=2592333 RepID=A0ABS7L891_9FIRM|nr:nucleoside-diphosphate sugar epimerase/dehydratase [Sellimonas caecigallum]MBY0759321.1 polysaccharide biosynthesis protein [Sellimonas caecigallum]
MSSFIQKINKNKEVIIRGTGLLLVDVCLIALCMIGALWIRFDFDYKKIEPLFLHSIEKYMWINIVCTVIINYIFKLYASLWRFASVEELKNVVCAVLVSSFLQLCGMSIFNYKTPRSYIFIYTLLLAVFMIAPRFSYRFLRISYRKKTAEKERKPIITMVVGAGAAGYVLVREMKNSKHLSRKIPCIIDDDPQKQGTYLQGIPIVGKKEDIEKMAKKYNIEEIIIAIPTISQEERKKLLDICQRTACKIKMLPGIYQMVNDEIDMSMLQEVKIEDLLGRDSIDLRMDEIQEYIEGKVILVTGGGGSIGSEICRQVALHNPKQLIIVDNYENNAYAIQLELKKKYPDLNLVTLIATVRERGRVEEIFKQYHPDIVYHAAAHKHVPLMEDSPNEAVKNNVLGTYNVAAAADKYHAGKMVLISTDKAVRPTNVMGASKRICELIVEMFSQKSQTEYAAVRFGNVLGSNGSVIPVFQKQIEAGGPVTVTHPEIIRYFMTIQEAVNLVLQCGAYASGGEIFILDMGEPVKILDMARKMIRLSGYVPDQDIKIVFTGLRPGEKLYEELLIDEKNLVGTKNDRIFIAQMDKTDLESMSVRIKKMIEHAYEETKDIQADIKEIVPEYKEQKKNTTT